MKKRRIEIDSILQKLREFKNDQRYSDRLYAIEENMRFAEAMKTLPSYVRWLLMRAPKIDGSKLLELTDFPVEEWDVRMHKRLIEMERKDRPGLVKPLASKVVDIILKENRPLILANLGAGGMEVDRQVISHLLEKNYDKQIIFIGVDKSPITNKIAKENLNSLGKAVGIFDIGILTKNKLEEIAKANKGIAVILCKNDIFNLNVEFPPKYFDLVYNSLFKHHLTEESDKDKLDKIIKEISKKSLEYDGYKNWPIMALQTLAGWNYPNFLNAEIFSNLRFKDKKNIIFSSRNKGKISFYKGTGFYLLEYF
ncbi:MAG: hypothetical protein HW401_777 [Parcubacteria group bacterium]|nr:hypothetical protein [Parcubacteria group bacterium]